MSSNPLSTQMQALINYANEATGEADTDLSAAVDHLVQGYGGGGGSTEIEDAMVTRTLTEYTNDRVTFVGASAFISMPIVSFSSASVTELYAQAFYACGNLSNVNLPNLETIGRYCFYLCSPGLKYLDFPKVKSIDQAAFMYCGRLTTLILRREDQVCSYATTASGQDPSNANLKIYVPSALVDSYKAADNWTRLADHFAALEDYTVDGTTTGAMNTDASGNIVARA